MSPYGFLRISVISQIIIGISLVTWDWELEAYHPYLVFIFFALPGINFIMYKKGKFNK